MEICSDSLQQRIIIQLVVNMENKLIKSNRVGIVMLDVKQVLLVLLEVGLILALELQILLYRLILEVDICAIRVLQPLHFLFHDQFKLLQS